MRRVLATLAMVAVFALLIGANLASAHASGAPAHSWYVCKYVGQPGNTEVLQTGQNPIFVDEHAIVTYPSVAIGDDFADAQGHSLVIAGPYAPPGIDPEPSCPGGGGGETTDVCPNIEGDQAEVPEGDVIDGQGNCVPRGETPPPPPPAGQVAFVFTSCTDTFVRFTANGNGWYAVDGVFTFVTITTAPQDFDLGQLPNGAVVYAGVNGNGDSTTVTIENGTCPTAVPPVTPAPPVPPHHPWHPTWNPTNAAALPADLAFTGLPDRAARAIPWALGLAGFGFGLLGTSAYLRRRHSAL